MIFISIGFYYLSFVCLKTFLDGDVYILLEILYSDTFEAKYWLNENLRVVPVGGSYDPDFGLFLPYPDYIVQLTG